MGMSTHVTGFSPPDDEWRKKKAAHDACVAAGVEPPLELSKFFGFDPPTEHGREIDISAAVSNWQNDARAGVDVDLSKLPPGVKVIRFFNAW